MSDPTSWQAPGSAEGGADPAAPGEQRPTDSAAPGQGGPGYGAPGYGPPQGAPYGPLATPPHPPGYGGYPAPTGYPQPGYPQPGYPQPGYGGYSGYNASGPGPQGWVPPPKPGLIPLRPLGFGTLIGAPFQVLRRNPKPTFGSALLIQIAVMLVTGVTVGAVVAFAFARVGMADAADQGTIAAGGVALIILAALVSVAVSLVGSALLQGVIVTEVARGTLGEKPRMRELWRGIVGRRWALVGWICAATAAAALAIGVIVLLVWLLVALGATAGGVAIAIAGGLALLALWAWLGVKLCLVPSVIVLERAGLATAIARSWTLTGRSYWRILGVLVLVSVICQGAAQVVTMPLSLVYGLILGLLAPTSGGSSDVSGVIASTIGFYAVYLVITLVIGAIVQVVQSATGALIYLDARMRREGLDLHLMRYVEARQYGAPVSANPFQERTQAPYPGYGYGYPAPGYGGAGFPGPGHPGAGYGGPT